MWFIQTPVDSLTLPTDSEGRTTLTGTVAAWHHLVHDNQCSVDSRVAISAAPIKWSIWAWQQHGRTVQLPEAIAVHESLVEMVRAEPARACSLVRFPLSGKRAADNTIEIIIVVPTEQFARYESLVQFAMTLPSGHVSITLPPPLLESVSADVQDCVIVAPGMSTLIVGLGFAVARGSAQRMSSKDLRRERRVVPIAPVAANLLEDDGDDWLLFAADRLVGVPALEEVIKE